VRQAVREKAGGMNPLPGGEFFSKSRGLQKLAYSVIKNNLFPEVRCCQLSLLCAERSSMLFQPYDIFGRDGASFDEAFEILGKTGGRISLKVVKTWLNGWATSHRMHEDIILDCLLGCKGFPDSLSHYVFCPHLYMLQKYLFARTSEDPLIRFGIKSPEIFSLKVISCLFSAYHALKGEVRRGKINLHSVSWINCAWSVFANSVKAEAGEMSLETRAFSLPKFIDFLESGGTFGPPANLIAIHDHQ